MFINLNKKVNVIHIHRLVAEAFISNPQNKPCVNHIDCNSSNNHISNLRYCTPKENLYNSKLAIEKRGKDIKYVCECGSIINNSNSKISRHEKTEKHKKYLNSLL